MEYATKWWQARKEQILMRKRILFAMLLATTSLLVACGSTSSQGAQDTQNTQETTNEEVVSNQEVEQEETTQEVEEKMILVNDYANAMYITKDETKEDSYRTYFNFIHQVLGSEVSHLEDTTRLQVYEGYRDNEKQGVNEKCYRHILIQFTNSNGTSMMIDIPHQTWDFTQIDMTNDMLRYRPQNGEVFEEIYFIVGELSNENSLLKDYENGENIEQIATWFPIQSMEGYKLTDTNTRNASNYLEIEENYAKIIYKTDYQYTSTSDGAIYDCSGYTCIYDDYENMKRFIIVYGVEGSNGKLPGSANTIESFLDYYIEIIDNEYHFMEPTSKWVFPQGMVGETQKTPMNNGMSINITNYTNSNNQEIKLHWYGPQTLGEQASEENGVLTLSDAEGNYRLNIQQVSPDVCEGFKYVGRDNLSMEEVGGIFAPLQEYEHYVENTYVDMCKFNDGEKFALYQITTDDGYKGYAFLMAESQFKMPNDEKYFITYVEKEDIYDDERALEVIKSIDYHLGIE